MLERFVHQPDESSDSFDNKLDKQLADVSDGAILLFAELYYLCLLPLADYLSLTKQKHINRVLRKMRNPVEIPKLYVEAFDQGFIKGGMAFKVGRFGQLAYLIEVAQSLLSPGVPENVWDEPLAFREWLVTSVPRNAATQRQSLLYLAFPDFYLPTLSDRQRKQIRDAFSD